MYFNFFYWLGYPKCFIQIGCKKKAFLLYFLLCGCVIALSLLVTFFEKICLTDFFVNSARCLFQWVLITRRPRNFRLLCSNITFDRINRCLRITLKKFLQFFTAINRWPSAPSDLQWGVAVYCTALLSCLELCVARNHTIAPRFTCRHKRGSMNCNVHMYLYLY